MRCQRASVMDSSLPALLSLGSPKATGNLGRNNKTKRNRPTALGFQTHSPPTIFCIGAQRKKQGRRMRWMRLTNEKRRICCVIVKEPPPKKVVPCSLILRRTIQFHLWLSQQRDRKSLPSVNLPSKTKDILRLVCCNIFLTLGEARPPKSRFKQVSNQHEPVKKSPVETVQNFRTSFKWWWNGRHWPQLEAQASLTPWVPTSRVGWV